MRRRFDLVDLATIAAVVAAGVLRLPQPLHGDTVSFMHGGQVLLHGGLYRTFWDIKPPGIFYFNAAGGALFGFDDLGLHTFELLLTSAAAVLTLLAARSLSLSRGFANLVVLFAFVPHYALGTAFYALQTEALVGPWLLACAWLATRGSSGSRLASGACGAVAIAFKQVFAPIVLFFWIVALREAGGSKALRRVGGPLLLGAVLTTALLAAPFALDGTLGTLLGVLFVEPLHVLRGGDKTAVLTDAFWWLSPFFPLFGLAAVGAARRRAGLGDPMLLCLVGWIVGGVLVIGAQTGSLWAYHFQLITLPAGVLAAVGLEWLWQLLPREHAAVRSAALAALALLLLPFVAHLERPLRLMAHHGFPRTAEARRQYQIELDDPHVYFDTVLPEADFLRARQRPGEDVYVLGNPMILHLAGNHQRSMRNEPWSPRVWSATKWRWLDEDLEHNRPRLLFMDDAYLKFAGGRDLAARLPEHYHKIRTGPIGVWWERTGSP